MNYGSFERDFYYNDKFGLSDCFLILEPIEYKNLEIFYKISEALKLICMRAFLWKEVNNARQPKSSRDSRVVIVLLCCSNNLHSVWLFVPARVSQFFCVSFSYAIDIVSQ